MYLTATQPFLFAFRACKVDEPALVVEIDAGKLDTTLLLPDERYLDRILPRSDNQRDSSSRQNAWDFLAEYRRTWTQSVAETGHVCFENFVSPRLIKRYCLLDWRARPALHNLLSTSPPAMHNAAENTDLAKNIVAWMFGDCQHVPNSAYERESTNRTGITVVDVRRGSYSTRR